MGRGGELTSNTWNGSIDEFRISVGVARWNAAFAPPRRGYSTAASGTCRGFFSARKTDGTIVVFAATDTRLLQLDNTTLEWADVSKAGAAYAAVPSTDQWQFAQFGSLVVAVQANTPPQVFNIATPDTAFSDLGGSPPTARGVTVVGNFLVLYGLTANPARVHWSDLGVITTWSPGTGFANSYDFSDGGVVLGVGGGEFGLVLQEAAVRRMVYVNGAKPAFQFQVVSEGQGLLGNYSLVRGPGRLFFYSTQGFQMYAAGSGLVPIGAELVDRSFKDALDTANLQLLIGAADPSGTRIYWGYKSIGSSATGVFDAIIVYDYALQRWSPPIAVTGEFLSSIVQPGLTLDGLDTVSSDVDALPFSLDAVSNAIASKLAAANAAHQLGFFSGPTLEATLETAEQSLDGGQRMLVRGFYPRTDAVTVYGSTRHRSNPQAALAQTAESLVNAQGFCPQRIDTRLARGRVRIPAGENWTYCKGIEPDFGETGRR